MVQVFEVRSQSFYIDKQTGLVHVTDKIILSTWFLKPIIIPKTKATVWKFIAPTSLQHFVQISSSVLLVAYKARK